MGKWSESWRIFRRCLKDGEFRRQAAELGRKGREEVERAGAVRIVAQFQEEGRLVDFLMEDMGKFDDARVGAAARSIHGRCRAVLEEAFSLKPVLEGKEGAEVTVREGFDPLSVRLEGNVGAKPPFKGILRHPGY